MIKQQLSQKLLQKLSPQQIQFIKLLQLNTLNFQERVDEELLENPALESGKEEDEIQSEESDDLDYSSEEELDITDYMSDDEGGVQLSGDYNANDEEKEFMPVVYFTSFRERLLEQISGLINSEQDEILADQIVGTLDDDGYLRRPLNSIKNDLLFTQNIQTTTDDLQRVLTLIQGLEPAGIGARDLLEPSEPGAERREH